MKNKSKWQNSLKIKKRSNFLSKNKISDTFRPSGVFDAM